MPQFAANLTMLFNEAPFLERFNLAAKAGFKAVEFLFPYAYSAQVIKEHLDANQLQLVLHNLPAGNWDAGERGIACHPERVDEPGNGKGGSAGEQAGDQHRLGDRDQVGQEFGCAGVERLLAHLRILDRAGDRSIEHDEIELR